ncbi:polysaccharide deacetylase family protein [Streptomyces sp. 8N706]|uniref:polysaccharide deacetylase family protein n=1 Tax=Streptomyces sp. 8N706 TaxID=3457416 RepID=UPI003FD37A8B
MRRFVSLASRASAAASTAVAVGTSLIRARGPRAISSLPAAATAAVVLGAVLLPAGAHPPAAAASMVRTAADSGAVAQPSGTADPVPADELFGTDVRRIPTTRRVVALTFNAAWNGAGVDTVLKVLRERKVPATFFLTGQFADAHPSVARAMAAEHGIGNHSYSHPRFDDLSSEGARQEVLEADRAIREATGAVPLPFFRFPYSETSPERIADVNALGFADIEFTADTNGYLGTAGGMSADTVVARALDALTPGEIVQMHVGAPDGGGTVLDAQALPRLIDAIQARGYEITDLRTLLSTATP